MAFDEAEQRQAMLDRFREEAHGLFDGLILMGTWQMETGETAMCTANDGNWHCQAGMMRHALNRRTTNAAMEERYFAWLRAQEDDA